MLPDYYCDREPDWLFWFEMEERREENWSKAESIINKLLDIAANEARNDTKEESLWF